MSRSGIGISLTILSVKFGVILDVMAVQDDILVELIPISGCSVPWARDVSEGVEQEPVGHESDGIEHKPHDENSRGVAQETLLAQKLQGHVSIWAKSVDFRSDRLGCVEKRER